MWDLPGTGLEPVFPALAGRFLTTAPPGSPHSVCYKAILPVSLGKSPYHFSDDRIKLSSLSHQLSFTFLKRSHINCCDLHLLKQTPHACFPASYMFLDALHELLLLNHCKQCYLRTKVKSQHSFIHILFIVSSLHLQVGR